MNSPIQSGDRCEIIEGALGTTGPNIGKIVTVLKLHGEHSVHGRIWSVSGENLVDQWGGVDSWIYCPQAWLRKLPPDEVPPAQQRRTEDIEA